MKRDYDKLGVKRETDLREREKGEEERHCYWKYALRQTRQRMHYFDSSCCTSGHEEDMKMREIVEKKRRRRRKIELRKVVSSA